MRYRGSVLRLRRDDSGASAIEYGLIAAFIGLGIVASLVSTKGSLGDNYNRIAGLISSSVVSPGMTPMGAYWASKTLKSKTTGVDGSGAPTTTYVYADGSQVVATSAPNQTYVQQFTLTDAATKQKREEFFNASGGLAFLRVSQMNANGGYASIQYSYADRAATLQGDPPQGNYSYTQSYDANGTYLNTSYAVGAIYAKASSGVADEAAYFAKLSSFP